MNSEGLHVIGIDLFQEVVTAYLTFQATGSLSKVSLGEPPKETLLNDLQRLYKMMPYADCKFIVEGEEILCHKGILGAQSERFKTICKEAPPSGTFPPLTNCCLVIPCRLFANALIMVI